ncbi:membrane protein ORF78 [Anguillid herpesvirus 1]|uniref:Membrane protein ORF78 n=1 Tax=Anguillid herpesvirus 1 TaxID=150286 RepID=A0A1J0REM6_9VIRU|nr:membrane protein ORF78 [Anguillid herpesvirus 1]ADA57841.1 membrane protein ORF78 [Anguillid herpesvirus 1]APD76240.1 membrane protein ORF78 [Anguillid herpesvirus 1]QRM16371.1 membrane protein ORF78 [Anguillid herpesvirus 1]QRM16499.1 membrane protein ORF78 [Anguillid herpesvirus 1]QRM16630.1 membrane protein ORF78 [Anguillid herpesvirus 1]
MWSCKLVYSLLGLVILLLPIGFAIKVWLAPLKQAIAQQAREEVWQQRLGAHYLPSWASTIINGDRAGQIATDSNDSFLARRSVAHEIEEVTIFLGVLGGLILLCALAGLYVYCHRKHHPKEKTRSLEEVTNLLTEHIDALNSNLKIIRL